MAGQKISELTTSTAQTTDLIPIARGNSNFSVSAQSISALSGGGTVTSVSGTGTVNGITLGGSVSNSGSLTLTGAVTNVDINTATTGSLQINRLSTTNTSGSSSSFLRGDGLWAVPASTPSLSTRPIVGMIAHSYGNNNINQAHILSYEVLDAFGTVKFTIWSNIGFSTNDVARIWGLGTPTGWTSAADGYWDVLACTPVGVAPVTATCYVPGAVGAIRPAVSVSPLGTANMAQAGSGGNGAGYVTQGAFAWANGFLGHAYDMPANYCYNVSGGCIVPVSPGDPGFVQQCTNLVTTKASFLPKYVFIEHGVNDANSSNPIANVITASINGLSILRSAGIIPIWLVPRPFVQTGNIISAGQWCQAFTAWLKSYMQKIGGVVIDTNRTLSDPTSSNNGWITGVAADNVHLSTNGGLRDGRVVAQQLFPIFRPCSGVVPSNTDKFTWSYVNGVITSPNPYANLLPAPSGVTNFAGGTFPATVAPVQLSDSTAAAPQYAQMGNVFCQRYLSTNSGNRTITVEVVPRTDTTIDGTPIPGNELKITFSAGTGRNDVVIHSAAPYVINPVTPVWQINGKFFLTTSGTPGAGTPLFNVGDQFMGEAEIYIPEESLDTTGVYNAPTLTVGQEIQYSPNSYKVTNCGMFTTGTTVFNRTAYGTTPPSPPATIGKDMRLVGYGGNSSITSGSSYRPSFVMSTPFIKWIGNYNNNTGSFGTFFTLSFGITAEATTAPFVVYVRGMSLRKVDSNAAPPLN